MNEQEEKSVFPPEEPDFEDPNFNWEEWDKLGFKGVAENIVTDIEAFGTPLIYGVYGRWGSGKTTMMRAIQDCFKARKGYKTVWFDPWWYDHADKEQLFLGLLRKIEKETNAEEKTFTDIGLRFGAGVRTAFQLLLDVGLSKLGTSLKNAKEFWKESLEVLGNAQINQVDAVEKTREALCRAINGVLKEDETLVLFVDDLDRCLPDRAILLLDQLKNFLYLSRVVTVLGIDDEVFANMLNKHYHYEEENFGSQYLDKIIRHSYRLGKGTIAKILEQYTPYTTLLKDHPAVIPALMGIWPLVGDINPRIVRRVVEKLIRIERVVSVEGVLTLVSNRALRDHPLMTSWSSFREQLGGKTKNPLNPEDALIVSLCCTIALSFCNQFPLSKEEYDSIANLPDGSRSIRPPLRVINQIHEEFKSWI